MKLRRYASFRVSVYWIVNLNRRLVECTRFHLARGSTLAMDDATSIKKPTTSP